MKKKPAPITALFCNLKLSSGRTVAIVVAIDRKNIALALQGVDAHQLAMDEAAETRTFVEHWAYRINRRCFGGMATVRAPLLS